MADRMSDRLPESVSQENWRAAIKADADTRQIRMAVTAIVVVVLVLATSITYCSTQPTKVNQEAQAVRVIELEKVRACSSAGGSWMPVTKTNGYVDMSCVTKETLPLVTMMNKPS